METVPGSNKPFEGVMFYSPSRGEYLVLPEEADFKPLWDEIQEVRSLRDKSRLAWEVPDPAQRYEKLGGLEKESEELFGGKKVGDSKAGVEELLLIQGNPKWGKTPAWVHIPAHDRSKGQVHVKGHWRKATEKQVQKNLDTLLNPKAAKLNSPFLDGKLKANLFKTEPKAGDMWHWSTPSGKEGKPTDQKENAATIFDYSAEAAAMRYFAGWDGMEASFDPKKKTLKLGTAGSASAAIFEGKVSIKVDLPDSRGYNILAWVSKVKLRETYLADPKRGCYLKLCLDGSLSTFVGGSVHGALSVSGNFAGDHKATAEAGGGGFAGARVNGDLKAGLNWAAQPAGPFAVLFAIKAGWGASAGAGLEGKLAVEYGNGVFCFRMSAAACFGLGLKGDTGFEVEAKEGWEFVGHLLDCLDFHYVAEITEEAFVAYRNYAFAVFTAELERGNAVVAATQAQINWTKHALGDFTEWLGDKARELESIKEKITARAGDRSLFRKVPPEALGRLLATVMQTRSQTDFQVIRYILGSTVQDGPSPAKAASGDHKLKWTLRSVSEIVIPAGPETVKEAKKEEALRDGIRIIREFGSASGKWEENGQGKSDKAFLPWFKAFLAENGV
ncbi:MAG: hypothetical protein JWP91_675 [Fibrobacteres bacterium]|nr:hypothetical protein [Fibrobacterota bacterium]